MKGKQVCVLGAGSWGTALAMVLSRHGRKVRLLARTAQKAERMQKARENSTYLPGIRFPKSLYITSDIDYALKGAAAVVVAVPCSAVEAYSRHLADGSYPVVAACKGLHPETLQRTDEFLAGYVGAGRVVVLSGPSFAPEVARGLPTAITLAASNQQLSANVASLFDDSNFRIYTCDDVVGVALAGALKNVIAIAAGIADGLQLGHNAVAALITRGLAEMSRLVQACGGMKETMMGMAGLGDLVLTCTGELSRNRRMGIALAQGMDVQAAKRHIGQVVEGVRTAEAAHKLAAQYEMDIPIIQAVYEVVSGRLEPVQAVRSLLSRPEKSEY